MIAFHFPPEGSSSGVHRTLAFTRHLPEHGWLPTVLTAHPRAYHVTRPDQLGNVPANVMVRRAFALDATRHLAIGRRYLRFTALPDRWASWWLGGVLSGLAFLARSRAQVIWSTYPIATAHLIGWTLHRISGLPWVADFRDSMTEPGYPRDERQRRAYQSLERNVMRRCTHAIFTTPGTVRMYSERYPQVPSSRFVEIGNGYDEMSFEQAEARPSVLQRNSDSQLILVHSGLLYPSERDPTSFFDALARLQRLGVVSGKTLRVILRAPGHRELYERLIRERGIESIVRLEGSIPYRDALREMLEADGLLIFQGSSCNHQIPAKVYEYMRAGRPVFALTDPIGDTAGLLRGAGIESIAPLDDTNAIVEELKKFVSDLRHSRGRAACERMVAKHSRRARSGELAALLDEIVGARPV